MNRLRAKIDKEIENKDIKKKLRNVQAKVHSNLLYNPNQTNYEKSGNLTGKSSARRSVRSRSTNVLVHSERQISPPNNRLTARRSNLYEDTSTYSKSVGGSGMHQQSTPVLLKQPLSMYMSSSFAQKSRLNTRQRKPKAKTPCILPAISDNEPIEEIDKSSRSSKSMHEDAYNLRNADSLSSSSSDVQSPPSSSRSPYREVANKTDLLTCESNRSFDCMESLQSNFEDVASLSSGSSTYLNLDLDLCSLDLSSPKSSDEIFHMAPLIPAPSAAISTTSARPQIDTSATSATLIRKFRNALAREERSMPDDDINVVKDVLKTDKRVNLLKAPEPDSNLFKDILKTQLDEIVKSEKAVTTALRMLGVPPIEVYNVSPVFHGRERLDIRKCSSSRRKIKSTSEQQSAESSPRGHSSFEGRKIREDNNVKQQRNVVTDTAHIKEAAVTPQHEVTEKKSMKNVKLIKTNVAPADEFEAFIKSTLPFKRRTATPKATVGEQILHRQQTLSDELTSKKSKISGESHSNFSSMKDARRPQVDVTFKNVPSVEKEILILKALGKRLEETLKRSVSEPSLSDRGEKPDGEELQACSSTSSLTRELKRIDDSIQVFPGRRTSTSVSTVESIVIKNLPVVMDVVPFNIRCVGFLIGSKGVRLEVGVAQEFVIVSKTVNELLSEPTNEFFIANEMHPGSLNPIPFQQVAGQPQVLMQYLKPKDPQTLFNLLDHDSIFFNTFLLPSLKSKRPIEIEKMDVAVSAEIVFPKIQQRTKSTSPSPPSPPPPPKITICEGGDSLMIAREGLPPLNLEPCCSKYTTEKITPVRLSRSKQATKTKLSTSGLSTPATTRSQQRLGGQRLRVRRFVTPMPCDAYDDPKNNLVKTILVGAVQVSIFLVMIMAITYPDIKC